MLSDIATQETVDGNPHRMEILTLMSSPVTRRIIPLLSHHGDILSLHYPVHFYMLGAVGCVDQFGGLGACSRPLNQGHVWAFGPKLLPQFGVQFHCFVATTMQHGNTNATVSTHTSETCTVGEVDGVKLKEQLTHRFLAQCVIKCVDSYSCLLRGIQIQLLQFTGYFTPWVTFESFCLFGFK